MMDTSLHATRSMRIRTDTPPPPQDGVTAKPPRLYSVPATAPSMPALKAADPGTDEKRNVRSAALVELVGRVLIEKMFFQNLHIPQDLLLSLVNNVIQTVAPVQKTKIDLYREGSILCKQFMGKTLTPDDQRYEQAPKEIDVPGEILNGIKYSAAALMGSNLYTSVTSAINQGLWNHVPAIVGYGGAMVFGPKVIHGAVEKVLACSGLNPEQKKHLAPWLTTVGRLALGFLPKVNANDRGVTYRHPSTEGHARIITTQGSVTLAGDRITVGQEGPVDITGREMGADDGMQFKLHAIHEITQDKLKLYVVDQAGKKIPVEFTAIQHGPGKEIVVTSSDKRLEDYWNQARQPTLPITQTRDLTCPSALVLGAVASAVGQNALPAMIASLSCWPEVSASAGIRNEQAASVSKRAVMQQQFPAVFNLNDLNGTNGFVVPGVTENGGLGISVSTAGDINGDNIADLVLSAPGENSGVGASYVLFGSRSPFPTPFNLSRLNGSNGFAVLGTAPNGRLGWSVSNAGDVNGDNITDLVLGADGTNLSVGASHVIFGSQNPFPASFSLSQLNGVNGFTIPGIGPTGRSGYSVSSAGDINGDGISDLVIGAPYAKPGPGAGYVIFGNRTPFPASFNLSQLNSTNGFTILGVVAVGQLGYSVSTAGDINGDNITDLVLGANNANLGLGVSYVIFGTKSPFPAYFNLTQLNGSNGFTIPGVAANGRLGASVSTAGDINGDGINDLVVGADGTDLSAGASHVIFGSYSPFPASLNLSQLNGTDGFKIPGVATGAKLGFSVSTAGDINGDNISDLVLGAYAGYSYRGTSYVIFGSQSPFPASLDLYQLNGANGFAIPGIASNGELGISVNTAGDINGDNITDLVLGAGLANLVGASYVIFGQNTVMSFVTPTPAPIFPPLTPCPIAQPLTLRKNGIQINQDQTLRVTPTDLSASCANNTMPNAGTLFNVTGIDHAQFKTRNSSGSWNNATSFLGNDLSQGNVELIHDNSALAPEINFTVTDGLTTLPETAANIQFNISAIALDVSAININIHRNGTTTLTPQQFQINTGGTRLDNVVISVTSVQGGYFTSGNSSTPIKDFTYYQLQDGQIQFVHNGTMLPNITLTVDKGTGEPVVFSPLIHFFNTDNPANPAVPIEAIVGSAAGAVALTAAVGMTAWGVTRYRRVKDKEQAKHKIQELPYLVSVPNPQNAAAPRNS